MYICSDTMATKYLISSESFKSKFDCGAENYVNICYDFGIVDRDKAKFIKQEKGV